MEKNGKLITPESLKAAMDRILKKNIDVIYKVDYRASIKSVFLTAGLDFKTKTRVVKIYVGALENYNSFQLHELLNANSTAEVCVVLVGWALINIFKNSNSIELTPNNLGVLEPEKKTLLAISQHLAEAMKVINETQVEKELTLFPEEKPQPVEKQAQQQAVQLSFDDIRYLDIPEDVI